jgi:hypothetical protein
MEKPAVEELQDFAKRTGRTFHYNEKPLKTGPLVNITYNYRNLYIPNDHRESSFYVSRSNPQHFGNYENYSGVFIPINLPMAVNCTIRKKDILDKINPFFKPPLKTGVQYFDAKTVVDGRGATEIRKFLKGSAVQELILKVLDVRETFRVLVNELDMSFIPGLKGQSSLGIVQPKEWVLDPSTIEKMFEIAEQLKSKFFSV